VLGVDINEKDALLEYNSDTEPQRNGRTDN